ncbi:group 1 family glycosyltransferase, partial [Candidatus Latescibacterota bacterium]
QPFPDIVSNVWQKVGNAQVIYMSPDKITVGNLRKIINATDHDILFINSFFNPFFSIYPLLLRKLRLIKK